MTSRCALSAQPEGNASWSDSGSLFTTGSLGQPFGNGQPRVFGATLKKSAPGGKRRRRVSTPQDSARSQISSTNGFPPDEPSLQVLCISPLIFHARCAARRSRAGQLLATLPRDSVTISVRNILPFIEGAREDLKEGRPISANANCPGAQRVRGTGKRLSGFCWQSVRLRGAERDRNGH